MRKKYYLSKKELRHTQVSGLIEEIIHIRQLLQNSRQKARIWELKANSLEIKLTAAINQSQATASIEPDHHLIGTIKAIEDFLYHNAPFMEESEYRKVLNKMNELTTQLLSFKREQPLTHDLN